MLSADLTFLPVTAARWLDLERLFGERGACGGCWCMWWRITRAQFEQQKGEGNRQAMRDIVASGEVPGILAYAGDEPIGWCSVAPREHFSVLGRSRILKPVDDTPVWSVVCFFVAKPYRGQGLSERLLRAAVDYVRRQGGGVVEGYPIEPIKDAVPDIYAFTGLLSTFRKVGFVECARRSPKRPIMRYTIPRPELPPSQESA